MMAAPGIEILEFAGSVKVETLMRATGDRTCAGGKNS
jgi:hypothetical protein